MSEVTEAPKQLALDLPQLPPALRARTNTVPLQFRLNESTRRRGLRHVAELRQLLAERQAARQAGGQEPLKITRRAA